MASFRANHSANRVTLEVERYRPMSLALVPNLAAPSRELIKWRSQITGKRSLVSSPSHLKTMCKLLAFGTLLSLSYPMKASTEDFSFDVHISLSERAAAKLIALSEGMVISASYSGDPVPAANKHEDEIGQIDLGVKDVRMPGKDQTVHVAGDHVNRNRLSWIQGPVLLNVNVYSARRSGPDNILACDIFDGRLQDAIRQPVSLHCSLIEENVETKHRV
jgi:hypothetical protein